MGKSHAEAEAPVKGYQLDAVVSELKTMGKQLETVINQTSGLATIAQLEATKQYNKEYTDESIKDVHAEYRPTLKRNKALWGLVGAIAVLVVGQAILISVLRS